MTAGHTRHCHVEYRRRYAMRPEWRGEVDEDLVRERVLSGVVLRVWKGSPRVAGTVGIKVGI